MKYAWIENNKIRDICFGGDPKECYHPDVAQFYDTQVPDDAANGDGWVDGSLIKAPPVVIPKTWTTENVRNNLSLAEKIKWDNETFAEIKTVKFEFEQPKNAIQTHELLTVLVEANIISQESMDKIMDGAIVTTVNVLP